MMCSQEELIAKRDALIEQLQGEWAVDADWKSIRLKAFRVGLCLWVGGMMLTFVIFPIMYVLARLNGTFNMQVSLIEFIGLMAAVLFCLAGIGSICVTIQSWFYRNHRPIEVDGALLKWDKGKGFVVEKLHLESLTEVADTVSTGYGVSWIFRSLGSSATLYSKHILVSEKDKNAPRITPGVFRNGLTLISLLKEIASINVQLNELATDDAA